MVDKVVKRFKVLMSAYACEPCKGSEPAVGWNVAKEMSGYHDIWVITRKNNRKNIEKELIDNPVAGLNFIYYDLPDWLAWWKRGNRGVDLYYYFWQIGIYFKCKSAHKKIQFDLIHHVTFVRYWMPSFLSLLPIPFIWGPVGGGESTPTALLGVYSLKGRVREGMRSCIRNICEYDPFVRLTAKRSVKIIATTEETKNRLGRLSEKEIVVLPAVGWSTGDYLTRKKIFTKKMRLICAGRMIEWKGFDLAIKAFSLSLQHCSDIELLIVGSGVERNNLEQLVDKLGVRENVIFLGDIHRNKLLEHFYQSYALIHPSLHDSGGMVCVEAMATGCPVIGIACGGSSALINDSVGLLVSPSNPKDVVRKTSDAIVFLVKNKSIRNAMGIKSRIHVENNLSWKHKSTIFNDLYFSLHTCDIKL